MLHLGHHLKALLKDRDLPASVFAGRMGVTPQRVNDMFRRPTWRARTLVAAARALRVDVSVLVSLPTTVLDGHSQHTS